MKTLLMYILKQIIDQMKCQCGKAASGDSLRTRKTFSLLSPAIALTTMIFH